MPRARRRPDCGPHGPEYPDRGLYPEFCLSPPRACAVGREDHLSIAAHSALSPHPQADRGKDGQSIAHVWPCSGRGLQCARPSFSYGKIGTGRCALTAPFHPYPALLASSRQPSAILKPIGRASWAKRAGRYAFCCTFRCRGIWPPAPGLWPLLFPCGKVGAALDRRLALWSSEVPPPDNLEGYGEATLRPRSKSMRRERAKNPLQVRPADRGTTADFAPAARRAAE